MALTDTQLRKYTEKILMARMNVMMKNPFFGSLLMHVTLNIDEKCETAYTDMKSICFGTKFLDEISDREVEFVLMHEILHVALQHCKRGHELNQKLFNIACDIVVNSIILEANNMSLSSITLAKYGESMHKLPDGSEGHIYTAEQVYYELLKVPHRYISAAGFNDSHDMWVESNKDPVQSDIWVQHVLEAVKTAERLQSSHSGSTVPRFASRILNAKRSRCIDWRKVLHTFLTEELSDYSFSPPDRRFSDADYFIPDFNGYESKECAKNVLFMIDTSGSVSDDELSAAFSEIEYALELFEGRLSGWVSFFDCDVTTPVPFASREDLDSIVPKGGGGTSFRVIFDYVNKKMNDNLPESIVIITDGCAAFPVESITNGIPVLWVITQKSINPPWGVVARM